MKNKNTKTTRRRRVSSMSDRFDNNPAYSDEKPSKGDAWPKRELFLFEPKTFVLIAVVSALTLLITLFGDKGMSLLTSVVSPVPAHAPFDGTTYPVVQVPSWVKLTEAERKLPFTSLPKAKLISTPPYNPTHLAANGDNLKWNDPADDAIRNEKITYSVPYLGNYQLDGLENAGSHPAVDIKVPVGTPVVSIANGTVIKVDNGNGGFGKHIVVQHNNVPTLQDPSGKTTLYSSYSHMSLINVQVYQVVTKGQVIGLSGMTGTATTPHVHFQIDSDSAPWHPYWPFSSADMSKAGYSFFQAINHGLGQSNAKANTINPLAYIQKYISAGFVPTTDVVVTTPVVTPTTTQPNLVATTDAVTDPYEKATFTIQVMSSSQLQEGGISDVVISAFDSTGALMTNPAFSENVTVNVPDGTATVSPSELNSGSFATGITHVTLSNLKLGKHKIVLRFRNNEFSSAEFTVAPAPIRVSSFELTIEPYEFGENQYATVKIKAFDERGHLAVPTNLTSILEVFADNGKVNEQTLTNLHFINGEATVSFTPNAGGYGSVGVRYNGSTFMSHSIHITPPVEGAEQTAPTSAPVAPTPEVTPTVVEVQTPITPTENQVFSDVAATDELNAILKDLKEIGVATGYPDGTFKPGNSVSRAEAIAFILRAVQQDSNTQVKKLFPDVGIEEWFAKYVTSAYSIGFIQGYPDGSFKPEATVNLAEFLKMVFIALGADVDPTISIALPNGAATTDWFAPYVQAAIKKNILVVENNTIDAAIPMTRGGVAKIIYLLKHQ